MRPPVPDIAPPRVRKPSFDQPPSDPRIVTPATFFLARSASPDPDDNAEASHDSMYGVQSLDDAINQATLAESGCDSGLSAESGIKLSPNPANDTLPLPSLHYGVDDDDDDHEDYREATEPARRKSPLKAFDFDSASLQPPPSDSELSRPLSPLNLSNPDDHPPSSLPSSPKSLSSHSIRPLDDISITDEQSQAVISGEEDNEGGQEMPVMGNDSMPQLIMPSLRMPSRRPFTERGKGMGRLKVVVAGASGSGKTSLIKSVVQECEDIVHVDPFPPILSSRRRRSSRSQAQAHGARTAVSEIYASTKPYPSWWSDLEDTRVLRRKRSTDDIVLERNLCFVDTPATSISRAEQTDAILHYVHQQLYRAIAAFDSPNGDFQNMLAGNGGSQVDAIIHLISQDTLAADVECIQKLCKFTNVVPVIAKSDLLSSDQIAGLKLTFQKQAQAANVKPFLFEDPPLGETDPRETQVPFAVSSAKSSDDDVMDASTLMSPEYVQPLVASELGLLVQNLFDRDHLAWMRHSAAKKLAQRQRAQLAVQPYVAHHSPSSSVGSPSMSGMASSNPSVSSINSLTPALTGPLDYTLARIADHTQREERLAQVHLASWASDLQQSLQNERQRYAAMARGDRAVWLTERLSECVVDGSLVPITQTPGFGGLHVPPSSKAIGKRHREGAAAYHISRLSPHDPLGVVWWTDDLKHRGWAILQIVGSFGVVGGLALWIARFWGLQSKNIAENLPWCSAIRA